MRTLISHDDLRDPLALLQDAGVLVDSLLSELAKAEVGTKLQARRLEVGAGLIDLAQQALDCAVAEE